MIFFRRILIFLLLFVLVLSLTQFTISGTKGKVRDWFHDRFMWLQGPTEPSNVVTLVYVTEECFPVLESYWPFSQNLFADAIDNIRKDGARVIALDFLLSDPFRKTTTEADLRLRTVMSESPTVISAIIHEKLRMREKLAGQIVTRDSDMLLTPHLFYQGAYLPGLINKSMDADGGMRRFLLSRNTPFSPKTLSLVATAILQYQGITEEQMAQSLQYEKNKVTIGKYQVPTDNNHRFLLNYRGPARHLPAIPFYAAALKAFAPGTFKDRIVIVGPAFKESRDFFPNPFTGSPWDDSGLLMPGAEIMATAIDTVISQKAPRPFSTKNTVKIAALFIFSTLLLIFSGLTFWQSFPLLVLLFTLTIALPIYLFLHFQIFINPFPLFNAVLFSSLFSALIKAAFFQRKARQIHSLFSRFVPEEVAGIMLRDGVKLPLEGRYTEVCILFCDIRGFTSYSSQTEPATLFSELNEIFSIIVEEVFTAGGTVDKFMGDAVMVIFGAPMPQENKERIAFETGIRIIERLKEWNHQRKTEKKIELPMGIGITRGIAQVGNVGSKQRMEYTAIGNCVNLASRLQGKANPWEILVDSEIHHELVGSGHKLEERSITLKGMEGPISAWSFKLQSEIKTS